MSLRELTLYNGIMETALGASILALSFVRRYGAVLPAKLRTFRS